MAEAEETDKVAESAKEAEPVKTGTPAKKGKKEKKAKRKDGWLLYPSMAVTAAAIAVVGFSGILFTPVGMTVGTICLVWIGFCAVANAKATRWGAK